MHESKIKFPDKHYVGYQKRTNDILLGFMTPYGTDSSAKKRMETVDSWSKSNLSRYDYESKTYIELDHIPTQVLDNTPHSGFYVGHSVNHSSSWNSCRDKWRIEDPRGFELEITSGNLEEILRNCTIINGKIQEECIWARLGANNILVPTNTKLYEDATRNTAIAKKSSSIKDAKPGDLVVLQSGAEGIFMGYFFHVMMERTDRYQEFRKIVTSDKKRYVFKHVDRENSYFSYSSIKVSEIHPRDEIENPLDVINSGSTEKNFSIHHTTDHYVIGVCKAPVVDFILESKYVDFVTIERDSPHIEMFVPIENSTGYWGTSRYNVFSYNRSIPSWYEYNSTFEQIQVSRGGYYSSYKQPANERKFVPPAQVIVLSLTYEIEGKKYTKPV